MKKTRQDKKPVLEVPETDPSPPLLFLIFLFLQIQVNHVSIPAAML